MIEAKQGNKIKLIDERTDNPDGMVWRNLLIDFFSTRHLDNPASEKKGEFWSRFLRSDGIGGYMEIGLAWELEEIWAKTNFTQTS